MSLLLTQANSESSCSDFWSASDHSSLTGSFSGWLTNDTNSTSERVEIDLLASETLSVSDDDSRTSTATPTFLDEYELSQASPAVLSAGQLTIL